MPQTAYTKICGSSYGGLMVPLGVMLTRTLVVTIVNTLINPLRPQPEDPVETLNPTASP